MESMERYSLKVLVLKSQTGRVRGASDLALAAVWAAAQATEERAKMVMLRNPTLLTIRLFHSAQQRSRRLARYMDSGAQQQDVGT